MSILKIEFKNESEQLANEVSIGFVSGSSTNTFNLSYSPELDTPLEIDILPLNEQKGKGNWYKLNELKNGVYIKNFSGRIYVSYGETWKVLDALYEPAQNITDPNFFLRYDKMELTFNGNPADVCDLTSIDYWSIPMKLETFKESTLVQTANGLKAGVTSKEVYTLLNNLTTPPESGLKNAKPALVPGEFKQHSDQPGSGFSRVIGPSSYPPIGGVPIIPYPIFESYLNFLYQNFGNSDSKNKVSINGLGNGIIAKIAGHFNGVGPNVPKTGNKSPQDYALDASIDHNLNIQLEGKVGKENVTLIFKKKDLINPDGIYGANASFSLKIGKGKFEKKQPSNDVYGWLIGDLFAGINVGALGSVIKIGGETVGSMKSSDWFHKIPNTSLFGSLQSNKEYYNQYAAVLQKLSDAYNFAYSDRFSPVQLSLNPLNINTLQISLLELSGVTK
jgi:hypothetical protein